MGYHLTILRTDGKRTISITRSEVEALAGAFPEWRYDATQDALVSTDDSKEAPALWLSDGELWTKNPSDATIAAMLKLAEHLKARVRGDEHEIYRSVAETYTHPDDADRQGSASAAELRAWARREQLRLWAMRAALVGGAALLGFLLKKFGVIT